MLYILPPPSAPSPPSPWTTILCSGGSGNGSVNYNGVQNKTVIQSASWPTVNSKKKPPPVFRSHGFKNRARRREYFEDHFTELMGFSLFPRARATYVDFIPILVKYLESKIAVLDDKEESKVPQSTRKLKKCILELQRINQREPADIFVHALLAVMEWWGQPLDAWIKTYPDNSVDEIQAIKGAPSYPHVVVVGESLVQDNAVCCSMVENNAMDDATSAEEAILISFGMYYVYSINYERKLAATMEFIQRLILKIDGVGSKIQREKGTPNPPAVHPRVMTLSNNLATFRHSRKITGQKK